ncbi:methyltransferase domain-containing protein [Duganella sp. FT92W]|uniref:Methyltransferase domain-containing protein n=1 Tax=Pseudoduganella rivuli TaxID=2666085 RepID=A0A7X2LRE0_9BURK|nr:methyltransferase regulatory domain-containing protein [Pseudoduganella rivuli]MRV71116.1 methyltransferase domain-containing protein [Pseudoduganella rivuli]
MMGWTSGYVSDVEYTAGFYAEQSPVLLNFVAVLNGYEPLPLDRPFTYFELGFGRGVTVNLLAASNPNGKFYAADFNPAHVAGATALADQAELGNVILLENSFEELAEGAVELPQFDFITLHGIYTWVTDENQGHIVDFISRYLKPGGIVYISYNALPGWAATQPLQRLLVEYGDAFPNRSDIQVGNAAEFIQKLVDAKVNYFVNAGEALQARLGGLKKHNRNYLVHEYMHKHWQPMYHADVARDLADAKLEFIGSADLVFAYPKLYLTEEKAALIATFPDPAMQETLKDYSLNTSFRKDVFVRGARQLSSLRRQELLRKFGLALTVSRDAVQLKMKIAFGEVNAKPELAVPICDALARGPQTLGQLAALPALAGSNLEDVAQLAALFVASRQAVLYDATYVSQPQEAARRMNVAIASGVQYGDEIHSLCSGLAGSAITAPYVARLIYWLMAAKGVKVDPAALAEAGWQVMRAQGRHMMKDGALLQDDAGNLAELQSHIERILQEELPIWRNLNML